jgi:hypothetical protein
MIASSNTVHSSVKPENYQAQVLATRVYGNYANLNEPVDPALEKLIGRVPMSQCCQG